MQIVDDNSSCYVSNMEYEHEMLQHEMAVARRESIGRDGQGGWGMGDDPWHMKESVLRHGFICKIKRVQEAHVDLLIPQHMHTPLRPMHYLIIAVEGRVRVPNTCSCTACGRLFDLNHGAAFGATVIPLLFSLAATTETVAWTT